MQLEMADDALPLGHIACRTDAYAMGPEEGNQLPYHYGVATRTEREASLRSMLTRFWSGI
jgi:hypothetical protein